MITLVKILLPLLLLVCACNQPADEEKEVKTTFQSAQPWRPTLDNRADAVMVYGIGGNPSDRTAHNFEDRVRSWHEKGYETHFMTGIAWGNYADYFEGRWDGEEHFSEGQVEMKGDTIWHGKSVPYIVPSKNYLEYMKECHVKRVIDAGISHIFMEEPEFWSRAGYSEAFQKEWQEFYGFPWRPQHESAENTWLSNKLKYHLYYRALDEVFSFAKEYGRQKGMEVKCYVPTHSLLNYTMWQIVSPEASLASLPSVDGYIAQVWTGTSRTPNYYNGKIAERVLETAYLEYGSMASMTAPTGRKVFFLTDPIEDWPRDWVDYKRNYEATFTAQLMYPQVADYEIMPWPERIYEGLYNVSADSEEKARIPRHYSTQMQVMVNALNKIPVSDNKVSGTPGLAVAMSNSLMFQRFPEHDGYTDPQLSNFFGLALPFLKRGVPVQTVHLENLAYKATLADVKVLLLTYSNMKPMSPEAHDHLAAWVKKGGVLVYSARDEDPFQSVMEWWNDGEENYAAPADHLFQKMGIEAAAASGMYTYGKGKVLVCRQDPKEYVLEEQGDVEFVSHVADLFAEMGSPLQFKNHFFLQRGSYAIVAVLDENESVEPYHVPGVLIDLYDPELPVCNGADVLPGTQGLFIDMSKVDRSVPQVLAAAGREYEEEFDAHHYSFVVKSPVETSNVMRIVLPSRPLQVMVDGQEYVADQLWDEVSGTCLLRFENRPEGVPVEIRF